MLLVFVVEVEGGGDGVPRHLIRWDRVSLALFSRHERLKRIKKKEKKGEEEEKNRRPSKSNFFFFFFSPLFPGVYFLFNFMFEVFRLSVDRWLMAVE